MQLALYSVWLLFENHFPYFFTRSCTYLDTICVAVAYYSAWRTILKIFGNPKTLFGVLFGILRYVSGEPKPKQQSKHKRKLDTDIPVRGCWLDTDIILTRSWQKLARHTTNLIIYYLCLFMRIQPKVGFCQRTEIVGWSACPLPVAVHTGGRFGRYFIRQNEWGCCNRQ